MDRSQSRKFVPYCPQIPRLVDQYMKEDKDSNRYNCINGVSKPIYDCTGNIHFSLPLSEWPRHNEVHPEVAYLAQQRGTAPRYLKLW